MIFSIGSRLGPYEISGPLGAGGMGEVYRARDAKLNRDVALKVLPEAFAQDRDRMARFEREAQVLASLNHPNIASIYGFEESGEKKALVMELVEGPTLADRIAQGPIPLDEALTVAKQIAEALEAAHDKGIIHRDLKPANVKITPEGNVKLLDFGLAKAFEGEGTAMSGSAAGLAQSPTLTARGTLAGIIIGTAAYMSPEQARGKMVDKRADIWAFGVVLYEMLTGRRAFDGETISDVLAKVIEREPDWNALPAGIPRWIKRLLVRCLEKDPKRRLRDIGDARIEISDSSSGEGILDAVVPIPKTSAVWRSRILVAALVIAALTVGATSTWILKPAPAPPAVARIWQTLPKDHVPTGGTRNRLALSSDGAKLVYMANNRLYLRSLERLDAVELADTLDASAPFFSPDAQWIGFFSGNLLKKTRVDGGAPVTVGSVSANGGDWASDGTILLGGNQSGILRISAGGGAPQVVVSPKPGFSYFRPQVLPDGSTFLYARSQMGTGGGAEIVTRSFATDDETVVLRGSTHCRYVPTGHLLYASGGALTAIAFDLGSRRTIGDPVTLVENIASSPTPTGTAASQFAISETGTLVYEPNPGQGDARPRLVAVNRSGGISALRVEARSYSDPRVSPDGRSVAVHLLDEQNDVWVADPARGTLTRLSFDLSEDETPAWSPDGRSIVWAASRGPLRGVYRRAADGSGKEELLWRSEFHSHVRDWAPDGRSLVVEVMDPKMNTDIWSLNLNGKPTAAIFLQTPFNERNARLSPDGRWLAYASDESGRDEVYVQSYPVPAAKVQISTSGGDQPVWSRDGRAVFFRDGKTINEARFQTGPPRPSAGAVRSLFPDRFESPQPSGHTGYDVWADGRFLMILSSAAQQSEPARSELVFVFNWFEELKERVPANK